MKAPWKPERFRESFGAAIAKLVAQRARAGKTAEVEPLEEAPAVDESSVVDLAELLRQSLGNGARTSAAKTPKAAPPTQAAAAAQPAHLKAAAPKARRAKAAARRK